MTLASFYAGLPLLATAPSGEPTNPLVTFLPLILIFVVFYFFIIRPQRKKEDQRKQMISSVKKGDRIVTIGGVHATVTQVDETSVLAQVDGTTKLRFEKSAIATIGKE
jgi:preprotein translocase subunit YajC